MAASTSSSGTYRCGRCELYLEDGEVREVRVPGHAAQTKTITTCPHCGLAVQREASHESHGLGELARQAGAFALTRDAWIGLVATGIGGALVSLMPIIGSPLLGGVAVTYLGHLLRQTAEGKPVTSPPDFVEVGDLLGPWLRIAIVFLLGLGPTWAALALEEDLALVLTLPWAALYLPAGLILVAYRAPFLKVLFPHHAIAIARAAGSGYVVMALVSAPVLAASLATWLVSGRFVALGLGLPIVGTAIATIVMLALPTVYARFLGLWVREHREELD